MNSERQTLILAGEPVPQRFADGGPSGRPLTLVATFVDDPKLIESTVVPRSPLQPEQFERFDQFAERGGAHNAANAYARTQRLAGRTRSAIIDTYA